jgi:hypothetical protein
MTDARMFERIDSAKVENDSFPALIAGEADVKPSEAIGILQLLDYLFCDL